MKRLKQIFLVLVTGLMAIAFALFSTTSALALPAKPNIIFIMADDLGNADLGYRGSDIKTPNIDKLAQGGARLEDFYGMPVCTPSRASLMTGRYAMRYGLQTLVIFPNHKYGLATDERTLPQALKEAGYKTAMVGKWHLGHADKKYWPQNRGFDSFYGNVVGEVDYFTKERGGVIDWQRDGKFLKEKGYYTTQIGDEAVKLIQNHNTKDPFFLYFASLSAHAPYQAPQKYLDQYSNIKETNRRSYAAMITALDDEIGKLVAALDAKGIRDNTLIVFSTDNGGPTSSLFATGARSPEERAKEGLSAEDSPPPINKPYSKGKGSLYEGGVRTVAWMNWPGQIKPGTVITEPIHMVDIFPTLVNLAGGSLTQAKPLDGKDIWATVTQGQPSPHEDILINVEVFRGSIRQGNWKLIKVATLPGKTELFDLAQDPSETTNLADKYPDVVKELEAKLVQYAKEQVPSLWIKSQVDYLGAQSETSFDEDSGAIPSATETILPK
jgi:arylsulfatase A-like enzyme